jgi:endonuclease/exonuclease/phosphatase family metal-dependent hydrolase
VLTWNIAAGHGDLAQIARVIRDAAPDVAALQEVDVHWAERSGFADQAAALAEAVGLDARFGRIYRIHQLDGSPPREYGLAILSRLPIRGFRNHVIPRLSTQSAATEPEPLPGFLEAAIEYQGTEVRVFNTHLDYRPDPRVRRLQVDAMLALMTDAGAAMLAGDLNAPPSAPELATLFRRLSDAWPAQAGDGFTYPANAPVRRIDYLLVSDHWQVMRAQTLPVTASDHLPVVAEILLKPGN